MPRTKLTDHDIKTVGIIAAILTSQNRELTMMSAAEHAFTLLDECERLSIQRRRPKRSTPTNSERVPYNEGIRTITGVEKRDDRAREYFEKFVRGHEYYQAFQGIQVTGSAFIGDGNLQLERAADLEDRGRYLSLKKEIGFTKEEIRILREEFVRYGAAARSAAHKGQKKAKKNLGG